MGDPEYKIVVIKPGILVRDRFGNILDARSNVILINDQTRNLKLLVDTGLGEEKDEVIVGLAKHQLLPENIDVLINTHAHPDHTGNLDLFPNAKFVGHRKEYWGIIAQNDCEIIIKDTQLFSGLEVIETPGHTIGSISVIVNGSIDNTKKTKIAITGDALPILDNYLKWVPPGINIDPQIAIHSMQKIIARAEIIIPGHDKPFKILNKKDRIAEYL
jgi:glyoxylase-like metal-dependent hydrolase (beta-lactamase superfamily II)